MKYIQVFSCRKIEISGLEASLRVLRALRGCLLSDQQTSLTTKDTKSTKS